ncbi:MAG: FecR domain-containing protein [Ramlibacter sp.]|nr:FecR domain-containing protein [Ramlibacter sp.]MBX3657284.1 FecR domain-containing protein [Ramlibacter sp.]MCW5649284.1 FecR domain-containing protein [Ramlibacter sp.]
MLAPPVHIRPLAPIAMGVCLLLLSLGTQAQPAGEVEFSRGVGFAQSPGQSPRTLGKGLPLQEGDRLTTADGASAIIKMADGTRMTVRPNSEIVVQQYRFKENAPDNSMLMQLLRGGFRAVTGLISKSSPSAARVQTNTATIGIRGTDFDARICAKDCGAESAKVPDSARPNAVLASAKVVAAQGVINAVDSQGKRRQLVDGGSVYPGDLVETGNGTRAVLAFRDDSRITLGAATKFRVDNFVYDEKNAGEGRFLVSLLRGSVRALTGLIAKANNRNVGFSTATATIGIRGSGGDITCTGACAGEPGGDDSGLTVFTWLGSFTVSQSGQNALQVLQAGQGLFISPSGIRAIASPPPIDGPRPDQVNVPDKLFSSNNVSDNEEGLFVFVRDGHIEIATKDDILQLGRGEAGFAGNDGNTARPTTIPKFLDFDKLPLPNSKNPLLVSVLADAGIKPSNQCK